MITIANLDEFYSTLDQAIAASEAMLVSDPESAVWRSLLRELGLMKRLTPRRSGLSPTEVQSVTLLAVEGIEAANPARQNLIDLLSSLNSYWRDWPHIASPRRPNAAKIGWAIGLAVIAVVIALVVALQSLAWTEAGPWRPQKDPIAVRQGMAALEISLEPYRVSLHPNPEDERYQVRMRISDRSRPDQDRLVTIPQHLEVNDLPFDAKLLGDDGHRIWFYVREIGAWDYWDDKLITPDDLRRANPGLGNLAVRNSVGDRRVAGSVRSSADARPDLHTSTSRLYSFDGTLRIKSRDYQSLFVIDPITLRAEADGG